MAWITIKSSHSQEKVYKLPPFVALPYLKLMPPQENLYGFSFFLAALGLCCCAWAFSSCGEQWLLFVAMHGLLVVVASLVAEHRL